MESRPSRKDWRAIGVAAAVAAVLYAPGPATAAQQETAPPPGAAGLPAPPKNGEMGFVLSTFSPAIYPGMTDNCPDGYARTIGENYLAGLPAAERERLSRPENEKEYEQRWKSSALGPNNTNVCTNYDQFPERPVQKTLQGKIAYGLDLDGDDGAKNADACPHESFVGPDGEKGIDNQAYRALGCSRGWRAPDGSPGDVIRYMQERTKTGEDTVVMLLRHVDNLVRDDDVEVILASSLDPPIIDAQQQVVTGVSFKVSPNPRWRAVLHGHIENGVLTTDPNDIVLRQPVYDGEHGPRLTRTEWTFTGGRLRLVFQADGTLKGVLGGYLPLFSFIDRGASSGLGSALIVNYDCASAYNTLKKLADGGRDPKTGQCKTISTAFDVTAVPAYVIDRATSAAEAETAQTR